VHNFFHLSSIEKRSTSASRHEFRADVGAAEHHTVASGDGVSSRAEPFGHPRKNIVKAEVGRFESLYVI
jgi:hypothetical protein